MKKHFVLLIALIAVSNFAHASKARLQALGEDSYGSQFISDARNVFLNPAEANMHKDFVVLEWGDSTRNQDSAATTATAGVGTVETGARAEGGVFMSSGSMTYGVYLGNESNTANSIRFLGTGSSDVEERNNLDIFVAGDAGVQWGVNLTHGSFKDEQTAGEPEGTASRVRGGVKWNDWDIYLASGLTNNAETTTAEVKGGTSIDFGVTYNVHDIDWMLRYQTIAAKDKAGDKFTSTKQHIGVAKQYKMNQKANMWLSLWYKQEDQDNEFTAISATGETKTKFLPLTVALEVAAKDWLVFRGSVAQDVYISETENDAGDKTPHQDGAQVAAGASIVWDDFQIDGMIGNNTTTAASVDGTTAEDTSGGAGTLRTDVLMSRVSMTYKF